MWDIFLLTFYIANGRTASKQRTVRDLFPGQRIKLTADTASFKPGLILLFYDTVLPHELYNERGEFFRQVFRLPHDTTF